MDFGRAIKHFANLMQTREKPAIHYGNLTLTYRELEVQSNRLAGGLQTLGIGRGARVGVLLDNGPEFVELYAALCKLGGALAPVSTRLVEAEVAEALQLINADVVVTSRRYLNRLERLRQQRADDLPVILVDEDASGSLCSYQALLRSGTEKFEPQGRAEDCCWILFTGGTTARSRASTITQQAFALNKLACALQIGWGSNDTELVAGSLAHGLPFAFGMAQLLVGGTVCILEKFDPLEALATIERHGVTWAAMVPTMFNMLLNVPGAAQFNTASIRLLLSGGSHLHQDTRRRVLEFFEYAQLYEYYGASDVGYFTLLRPGDNVRGTNCVGQAMWGTDVIVLDDNGVPLPNGQIGTVYRCGLPWNTGLFGGLAGRHDKWITAGDLGWMDEDGYVYVVDRKKDMIVSGGLNVYSWEVEEVINSHPDVMECAVIGIPHPKWDEAVHALVVLMPSVKEDSPARARIEAEIRARCAEALADYKRPKSIEFRESLPKNHAGKILKRNLRAPYWERQGLPTG